MNNLGFPGYRIHNGYLPTGETDVHINDGVPDVNGCYWWLDGEIDGWDSPEGRGTMLPLIGARPTADGEIAVDVHYKGRTLKFCLIGECPTEAAREAAWAHLGAVLDLLGNAYTPQGGTFFADEVIPVQLEVFRTGNQGQGKLALTNQGFPIKLSETRAAVNGLTLGGLPTGQPAYIVKAEIELYAPDPRKYTQTPVAINGISGSATVSGIGGNTMSQNCVLTMTDVPGGLGPVLIEVQGPVYTDTMRLVVPSVPLGAPPLSGFPNPLVIDFYHHTIKDLAGNNFYYLRDLTSPWPSFPPDGFTVRTLDPQGFQATLYPGYV